MIFMRIGKLARGSKGEFPNCNADRQYIRSRISSPSCQIFAMGLVGRLIYLS
jgi:hypothetical protein